MPTQGDHQELGLEEDEGLAEAIHFSLFPNGVIGAEFFFFGPRITRFSKYLWEKCQIHSEIRPMVRHDVIEQAMNFNDIRLLRIKIDPSLASRDAVAGTGLGGLLTAANDFEAGVYADLTLRSERYDDSFRGKVVRFLERFHNDEMETEPFEKLEIAGKREEGRAVETLDLLSEKIYRSVEIPFATSRTRELDADSAFAAIRQAYADVEDDLSRDALG